MKKRNQILVVDCESTCWKNPDPRKVSEIIEVGLTTMSRTSQWQLGYSESFLVTNVFGEISNFCTELTGITQESINIGGVPYPEVISHLVKNHDSKNSLVACWGKYDDKMFQIMSKMHKCPYPFNNDYLNIKALYGMYFGVVTGLADAMETLDMKFEGVQHSGKDDSRNAARVLLKLLERTNA